MPDEFGELFKEFDSFYKSHPPANESAEYQRRFVWATRFYELGKSHGRSEPCQTTEQ
jgi:hypothetical protein